MTKKSAHKSPIYIHSLDSLLKFILCMVNHFVGTYAGVALFSQVPTAADRGLGKAGPARSVGPSKFGAEVINCIWRLFLCCVLTSAFIICF